MFTEGNPGTGTPATVVGADWLNDVQEELCDLIEAAGITLVKGDTTQLLGGLLYHAGRQADLRNEITNPGFRVWQRGTSFVLNTAGGYTADRWRYHSGDGSAVATVTRQAFTLGQTAVPGEPTYYLRAAQTAGSATASPMLEQRVESVRKLAGETVQVSIWLQVASGTLAITPKLVQHFGTGGSPSTDISTAASAITVTTTWTRFTISFAVPGISGKTLGTDANDYLAVQFLAPSATTFTLSAANAQLEEGPSASAFRLRPLTVELDLCRRFYEKTYELGITPGATTNLGQATGHEPGNNAQSIDSRFRVTKRATPTVSWYAPDGTSGSIYWEGANRAVTATNDSSTERTGVPAVSASRGNSVVKAHWTAEAEL